MTKIVTTIGEIDLDDPKPIDFMPIADIAKILSTKYRWNGCTRPLISVARHSCVCAMYAKKGYVLEALLHDITEAYMGDLVRPLKDKCPDFINYEGQLHSVIAKYYGLPDILSPTVKSIDNFVQKLEVPYVISSKEVVQGLRDSYSDVTVLVPPKNSINNRIAGWLGAPHVYMDADPMLDAAIFVEIYKSAIA